MVPACVCRRGAVPGCQSSAWHSRANVSARAVLYVFAHWRLHVRGADLRVPLAFHVLPMSSACGTCFVGVTCGVYSVRALHNRFVAAAGASSSDGFVFRRVVSVVELGAALADSAPRARLDARLSSTDDVSGHVLVGTVGTCPRTGHVVLEDATGNGNSVPLSCCEECKIVLGRHRHLPMFLRVVFGCYRPANGQCTWLPHGSRPPLLRTASRRRLVVCLKLFRLSVFPCRSQRSRGSGSGNRRTSNCARRPCRRGLASQRSCPPNMHIHPRTAAWMCCCSCSCAAPWCTHQHDIHPSRRCCSVRSHALGCAGHVECGAATLLARVGPGACGY